MPKISGIYRGYEYDEAEDEQVMIVMKDGKVILRAIVP